MPSLFIPCAESSSTGYVIKVAARLKYQIYTKPHFNIHSIICTGKQTLRKNTPNKSARSDCADPIKVFPSGLIWCSKSNRASCYQRRLSVGI